MAISKNYLRELQAIQQQVNDLVAQEQARQDELMKIITTTYAYRVNGQTMEIRFPAQDDTA